MVQMAALVDFASETERLSEQFYLGIDVADQMDSMFVIGSQELSMPKDE